MRMHTQLIALHTFHLLQYRVIQASKWEPCPSLQLYTYETAAGVRMAGIGPNYSRGE